MLRSVASFSSLLIGTGIFMAGSGLLGLLMGLRGAEQGFSDLTIGLVMSGFYVGYVLGAWLCPALIHQVGHIRVFTACAAGSAAAALISGLVVDPVLWWVLRIVSGVMLMGLYMVVESWLIERSNDAPNSRGQIFSVYVMVNLGALALGQYLLLVYGVQGVNSFVLVAILFSLALIPVALTPVAQPAPIRTERVSTMRLFAVSPVGAMGALFSGLISGSFWAMAAVFGRDIGLTNNEVAGFVAVTIAGGTVLQWPVGWLSDRFDRRHIVALASIGSAAAMAFMLSTSPQSNTFLYASAFFFGGFAFSLYGLSMAQAHDRFLSHEVLEATRGILLVHGVGAAIGPILTGYAMTWLAGGFAIMLAMLSIVLAAFVALRIKLDPPVPLADRTTYSPMKQTSPVAMDLDPRTPELDETGVGDALPEPLTPAVGDLPAIDETVIDPVAEVDTDAQVHPDLIPSTH